MNPAVPQGIIENAYKEDPAAAAEYGAEFRRDIEAFVSQEAVEAVVISKRLELPPVKDLRYFAFVDPSGGFARQFYAGDPTARTTQSFSTPSEKESHQSRLNR